MTPYVSSGAWIVILLDFCAAVVIFHITLTITQHAGFGNHRERMQGVHRVLLITASILFGWHAVDIYLHPSLHGVTPANQLLHVTLLGTLVVSAIRIRSAQKREIAARHTSSYSNGDALTGPLGR